MAKEKKVGLVRARVLLDCAYGKCNDVIEIDAAELANGEDARYLDSDTAAVEYADSLAK